MRPVGHLDELIITLNKEFNNRKCWGTDVTSLRICIKYLKEYRSILIWLKKRPKRKR